MTLRAPSLVVFLAALLGCAGCFLDRGGIAPQGRVDGGSLPDGAVSPGDAGGPCVPSGAELCDGVDNDCDPATPDGADEPTLGDRCDGPDDADHCEDGSIVCSGGELSCHDPADSTTELEVCDGVDNDCRPETPDGMADPAVGLPCDDGDTDLCADGTQACVDGGLVCTGEDGEDDLDVCNGIDDDCDPSTPDGYAEAWFGAACDGDDADLCAGGAYACVSGAMACAGDDGDLPSEVEVCDGVDNDCNPATADGAADPMVGTPCDDPGDLDLCPEGAWQCAGSALVCAGDDGDQPDEVERCDGVDNDCNPLTPDGAAETLGGSCDGPDADLCHEGTITGCAGGVLVCSDATGDSVETCNGLDDDCDGTVDEGVTCAGCTRVARGPRSYLFCAASVTWTAARDACRALGGAGGAYELVSISSSEEQIFVANTAAAIATPWWWIGLNDRGSEGNYTWVADGSALGSYRGWESGQPNDGWVIGEQDCVAIDTREATSGGQPGGWNDVGCDASMNYVCESP